MTAGRVSSFSALLSSGLVPVLSLFLSDELLKSIPPRPSLPAAEVAAVVPRVRPKALCPSPDDAVLVPWKSEPPKPVKAPPKERPVEAVVVVAAVPLKLFRVNPVDAAGVDVSADESVRLLAEVEAMGSAKGVADAAGLLKPKLKPIVDADVVAAVPVVVPPRVNPVAGLDPKRLVPNPPEADVVAGVAVLPRVPKLSPTVGLLDVPVPKEKPPPVLLPPAATVEEPSVLLPKENPVDMAAGSARPRHAKGSARRYRLKAQVGPAASLPPSRDLARTPSPAAAKTDLRAGWKPRREIGRAHV